MLRFWALAVLLSASSVPLSAQAQPHEPPSEAMTLFESARAHYRAGEYDQAATDLENALVIDPSAPTLLFNLGRVYELQGDYDRSISAYRRLLAVTPREQTEERAQTQTTIERLEGAQSRQAPPPQELGDDGQGPTFVRERGVADEAFWGLFAGAGFVGLAAIACGIASLVLFDDGANWLVQSPDDLDIRSQYLSQSSSTAIAADVLGSISVAAFAAAFLLFVLRERTYESWDVHAGRSGLELAFHWDGAIF